MVSDGVRGLVTGPDGEDLLVRASVWDLPVGPGGVLVAGSDLTAPPFGVVELVVERGLGAGSVHRLDVGTYRCGPDPLDDVPLPSRESWLLDVGGGGVVDLEVAGRRLPWPLDEARHVAGLDLRVRWCRGPEASQAPRGPARIRSLADLLLDRVGGLDDPDHHDVCDPAGDPDATGEEPTWALGRPASDPGGWVAVPVADEPVLVVGGSFARAYARGVLARLLADDPRLRLTLLAPGLDPELREGWAWLRWLPQARACDHAFVRVGFDDESCARWSEQLSRGAGSPTVEVPAGVPSADATSAGGAPTRAEAPLLDVVVVDGRVGDLAALARPGVAAIVVDDVAARAAFSDPARTDALVLDVPGPRAQLLGLGGARFDLEVDLPERRWADRLARTFARTDAPSPAPGRLLDLLGVDPADEEDVAAWWQAPPTTCVVVGSGDDGELVTVDLAADGPHALVGGTTGAGKSELLQTLVASLALANPPEAMSFLLVDYKGGAAFAGCAGLPHTVGVVTDLDAGLTRRALASLAAEVRRRELLLADAGVADLTAYLGGGHGPLARLVIVVDEFATLATELPDFVDGLVDIARRGRSLGLHLVLATQRPAGAVSADIRANTTLRIALRVAEAADSVDVIGVPDAVELPEDRPGHALVRVGRHRPVPVQAARVTTLGPSSEVMLTPYAFGRPLPVPVTEDGRPASDLTILAATMTALVSRTGRPLPTRPWLPPLPTSVDLAACEVQAAADGAVGRRLLPYGLEDHPDRQRRAAAVLDLDAGVSLAVVGGTRSGRSGVLATLAVSVAATSDPADVHVYGIDAGAHGLAGLEGLPHVGVVVGRGDPGRIERLLARLVDELDRRSLRRVAPRPGAPLTLDATADDGESWPSVLLLVDRWDLLTEAGEAADDRALIASMERLATEGGRVGISVVASGDRAMLTGRLTSVFGDRLVLRLGDAHDYLAAGLPGPAGHGEPGRGWRCPEAVETQVADTTELRRLLGALPAGLGEAVTGGPFRIEPLPTFVTRDEVVLGVEPPGASRDDGVHRSETGEDSGDRDRRGVAGDGTSRPLRLVPTPEAERRHGPRPGVGAYGEAADRRVVPLRRPTEGSDAQVGATSSREAWSVADGATPSPRSGALLVAVGGDDAGPVYLDADEYGPCALVTGRRRSGRSGVLLTLVESALAEDWKVVVVTGRRSPLVDVAARSGGRVHGPVRRDEDAEPMLAAVHEGLAAGRRVLVVADDVDLVPDGELLDALAELPALLRDTGSWFVGSGEAEEILGAYRGPAPMLRRSRCGVMLAPQGAEDGEAFGVRLRRSQYGRPLAVGAGYLVLDGLIERVQVIRSSLFPGA